MKGANYNMHVGNYILLDSSKKKNHVLSLNTIICLQSQSPEFTVSPVIQRCILNSNYNSKVIIILTITNASPHFGKQKNLRN